MLKRHGWGERLFQKGKQEKILIFAKLPASPGAADGDKAQQIVCI